MLKLNATTTAWWLLIYRKEFFRLPAARIRQMRWSPAPRGWRKSVVPTARPWLWYASDGLMIMPKR